MPGSLNLFFSFSDVSIYRFCQLESENMNMDTRMLNKVLDKHASPGSRLSGRRPWSKSTISVQYFLKSVDTLLT